MPLTWQNVSRTSDVPRGYVKTARAGRFATERLAAVLRQMCQVHGLDHRGAQLLRFTNNAVYRLPNEYAVVRIVASEALRHRAYKVVRVAEWLAEHDIPAARLLAGFDQPVVVDGYVGTIWQYVDSAGPLVNGTDLGRLLRCMHAVPPPSFPLPAWNPLDDVLRRLGDAEDLDAGNRAFLLDQCDSVLAELRELEFALPRALVHGDAHLGNLIAGQHGAVLCDFDSTCVGPAEWDLIPVALSELRFGRPSTCNDELIAAYGFDVREWPGFRVLRTLRELKLTTSVLPILRSNPTVRAEWQRRMDGFRTGDTTVHWTPFR
ncbi:aminoglycoside phosphotransferase family protein [Pseudonocardiaceae bacterium YIM PH 21723]|nr:aminoglycoside phosphotransferase family protein [Pseudonocardiaceae bacterium YIM PH 21723]